MISGFSTYIRVGKMEFYRVPELRILSERHKPLTRMAITVPDPTGNIYRSLAEDAEVSVVLGYRGQDQSLWEGTLGKSSVTRNRDQLILHAIGPDRALDEQTISLSFLNETPEAIVKYAVERAGLTAGRIDSAGVTLPRFVASNIPVWQVARQCEHTLKRAHGLDMREWALWMGRGGKVNWCPGDEEGDVSVIESGSNLISHSPGNGPGELSSVETFVIPELMHSRQFRLKDARRGIDGEYRAVKVEHILKDSRARTMIGYGEEYARY